MARARVKTRDKQSLGKKASDLVNETRAIEAIVAKIKARTRARAEALTSMRAAAATRAIIRKDFMRRQAIHDELMRTIDLIFDDVY